MSRAAYGQVYREPGGGGGRGVQMASTGPQALPSGTTIAIIFDALGAEPGSPPQYDDFGLRSTTTFGFQSLTQAIGSAIVIDAAHEGRWKIGGKGEINSSTVAAGGSSRIQRQVWIYVNDDLIDDSPDYVETDGASLTRDGALEIQPVFKDLVEDDVVWMPASADLSGGEDSSTEDFVLTMEWCGWGS